MMIGEENNQGLKLRLGTQSDDDCFYGSVAKIFKTTTSSEAWRSFFSAKKTALKMAEPLLTILFL